MSHLTRNVAFFVAASTTASCAIYDEAKRTGTEIGRVAVGATKDFASSQFEKLCAGKNTPICNGGEQAVAIIKQATNLDKKLGAGISKTRNCVLEARSAEAAQACFTSAAVSDAPDVLRIQKVLNELGCQPGALDGDMGDNTKKAFLRFVQSNPEVRFAANAGMKDIANGLETWSNAGRLNECSPLDTSFRTPVAKGVELAMK
jgi:hypothetical protein